MPAATSIAIAGLVIAAVGTGVAVQASRAQSKAQSKAAKSAQKQASLVAARARRRTIREARIARAVAVNTAGQVGAGQSSGLFGGVSSLASQEGSALGFSTQREAIGRNITKFGIQASRAASRGAIGSGLASFGGALFSNASGISDLFGSGGSGGFRGGGITGGGR